MPPFAVLALVFLPAAGAAAETVRVFADATFTDAFRDIAKAQKTKTMRLEIEYHFADSFRLRRQIEQGAPADVFASYDVSEIDALEPLRLVRSRKEFAQSRLAIAASKAGAVKEPKNLVRLDLKIAAARPESPLGTLTDKLLEKMQKTGLYGSDYRKWVSANIVRRAATGRDVARLVAAGEIEAGLAPYPDVRAFAESLRVIDIPDAHNVRAAHTVATLRRGTAPDTATFFTTILLGPESREILRRHGFLASP
jgi:molybdate transport system substrate-binding protein